MNFRKIYLILAELTMFVAHPTRAVRQFVSEKLQIDCAFGNGISGVGGNASWFMAGFRYVVSFNK